MNYISKLTTLLFLAVFAVGLNAQSYPTETTVSMDKVMMSAVKIELEAPTKEVEKFFVKRVEDRYNVDMDKQRKKGNAVVWASDEPAPLAGVTDMKSRIWLRFEEEGDNRTNVYLTGAMGENSFGSRNYPREYRAFEDIAAQIGNDFHRDYFGEVVEDAADELEDVRKEREKMRSETEKLREKVVSHRDKIAQLEKEIIEMEEKIKKNEATLDDTSKLNDAERRLEEKRDKLSRPGVNN